MEGSSRNVSEVSPERVLWGDLPASPRGVLFVSRGDFRAEEVLSFWSSGDGAFNFLVFRLDDNKLPW